MIRKNQKGIIFSKILNLFGLNKKNIIEKSDRNSWEEMIINDMKKNRQPERLLPDFFDDENLEDWTW